LLKEVRSPGLPRRSLSTKRPPYGNECETGLESTDDHKPENFLKGTASTSNSSPSAESADKSDSDAAPNAITSPTTVSYIQSASYPFQRQEAIDNGDAGQDAPHRAAKRKLDEVNNKLAEYGIQVSKLEGDPTPRSIESRKQCHSVALQLDDEVLPHLEGMDLSDAKSFEFFRKYLIMETRELLHRLKEWGPISRPRSTKTRRTRGESDPESVDQADDAKPPAKKHKSESIDQADNAETSAKKHNPLYGGPNEIFTLAYKVPNNLKEVHRQCKFLEKDPGVEGTLHATNLVKRACEILRWTAEFVESLATIGDEALERLPDDLFERSGTLLHEIFHCGKKSLKHRYAPVVDYGLPCARQIQITLESLDKRRERYRNWEEHRKVKFSLPMSAPS
jgi:hypothetical protein